MRMSFVLLAGVSVLASTQALADTAAEDQPVAAAAESYGSNDILVTARRREERLQDVPVAITAINNAAIERQAIAGLQDVRRISPSLNVSQSAGGGRQIPLFTIRGQRQGDTLATVDPSVGVYMGDVLFKRAYGLEQVTFDLNTIEVLKGPQGTLFGLNVTGGNIVFRPNLPTDKLEASIMAGIGNFNYRTVEGYVNLPLAEGVALRVAGQYKKRDGYIRDVGTGHQSQDLDGGGVRVSLKLNPTAKLESVFVGNYMRSGTGGTGWKLNYLQRTGQSLDINTGMRVDNTSPTSIFANSATTYTPAQLDAALAYSNSLGFYQTRQSGKTFARTAPAWNIANTTTYELSNAITLKNIIGYREYKTDYLDEVDGSYLSFLEYGNYQKGSEFSEEFQILGSTDELNWIIGAYYQQERVHAHSYSTALISPAMYGLKIPYNGYEKPKNTTKSIFASGTQKLDNIIEGLSLTFGGRYTWDTRESTGGIINNIGIAAGTPTVYTPINGSTSAGQSCSFNATSDPGILAPQFHFNPATCFVTVESEFSKFTYTATLDWKAGDGKLFYLSHRKGYRAGGFNSRAESSAQLVPFRPETVYDFEVGAKFDFRFDNGMFLRTNLAAYKQNYTDIQRLTPFVTASGGVLTNVLNAGKATIKGFEAEVTFQPTEWLELGGFLSHVDPQYKTFIVQSKNSTGQTVDVNIAKSATFAGAPRWQAGASGRVTLPTPESIGKAAVQLNYYYQSRFAGQDTSDYQPAGQTAGYGLLNGRIELNDIGGMPLRAAFFANNITNKKHDVFNYALQYSFGFTSRLVGPPRMYGLELRYTFGQ